MAGKRTVIIGASSGIGRCVGVAIGQQGDPVALLARRKDRIDSAAKEAGDTAVAIACDVTDERSCRAAVTEAAEALGGIDALVYTPGVGNLARLVDLDAATWRHAFDVNVIGAAIAMATAVPYLEESNGAAIFFSSVSASLTPPWPGLGAYGVSKAALDKLCEAWRNEHPNIGVTRMIVGECGGGEGEGMTGFADGWDFELAAEFAPTWMARQYMTGALLDVNEIVDSVQHVIARGSTASIPSITIAPRGAPDPRVQTDGLPVEGAFDGALDQA